MSTTLLYMLSYTAFAALTKLSGGVAPPLGILPAALAAGAGGWAIVLWWAVRSQHWRPAPVDRAVVAAGLSSVLILLSSQIAYSLPKTSIVLPLILMKGGVLLIAPLLDLTKRREISGRAALAWLLSAAGLAVTLSRFGEASAAAMACAAVYLVGYVFKLAAIDGRKGDRGFLVSEMAVTTFAALPLSLMFAAASGSHVVLDSPLPWLAGLASQGCGFFGGLLLLRKASHSLCVPLNRSASLLAGTVASVLLGRPPEPRELFGAVLLVCAVVVASRRG